LHAADIDRSFSEILNDNPALAQDQRAHFVSIIVRESERLTRLINQVLDLAKLESGNAEWHSAELDLNEVIHDAVSTTSQLLRESGVVLALDLPPSVPPVQADQDR
jgi:signal transduction histidine kinase